jgi:beta-glucosidase
MRAFRTAVALAAIGLAVLVQGAPAGAAEPGSPCADPSGRPWCDGALPPDQRAGVLLAQMTPEEKFELMGGDDPSGVFTGRPANGTSNGVARLGIPTLYFNDGPAGIRKGQSTGMPAPIGLAATFSPPAAARYGQIVGTEAYNKAIHVVHAPAVNIARVPLSGRTFEYYGEDPWLAARTSVAFTRGLEGTGAIGNVKHYLANNQETDRFLTNAIVDERTLREIYVPAFEATVREADVGSVMLSYNRVNGKYVTENPELVNGLLKGELGFRGIALTDYGFAQRSTCEAAKAGTDLELPQGGWYSKTALTISTASGCIPMEVIDEHVQRILRTMFRYGIFDEPPPPDGGLVDVEAHERAARELEEQAIVLLKNAGNEALPLDASALDSIAVIGPEADSYRNGGGSSDVEPRRFVTPLAGIRARAGDAVDVRHDDGRDPGRAAASARGADAAVVVVNDNQTEFVDKPCLSLQCGDPENGDQDGLVRAVAAANPRTIVVLETGGPVLMPWAGDVEAIVEAWYPGQEGGTAIARVLFGDADPGGRLPITFPLSEDDLPTAGHPERYPGVAENAEYSEGVFVGYRHYEENGIKPHWGFGYGRSYTRFRYRRLRIKRLPGGGARIRASVTNIGSRPGTDVAQLYLGLPDASGAPQPPRALKGFRKITLRPGRRKRVRFKLDARAFSYWDAAADRWTVAKGCHRVMVGRSSRNIRLRGRLPRGRGARCR